MLASKAIESNRMIWRAFIRSRQRTSSLRRNDADEMRAEFFRREVAYQPPVLHLVTLMVEKENGRRPDDAMGAQQGLVSGVIGGDVGLQRLELAGEGLDFGLVEGSGVPGAG